MVLEFTLITDEQVEVRLNGEFIIELNHDDHGWAGMDLIRSSLEKMARIAGWEVRDGESVEVD